MKLKWITGWNRIKKMNFKYKGRTIYVFTHPHRTYSYDDYVQHHKQMILWSEKFNFQFIFCTPCTVPVRHVWVVPHRRYVGSLGSVDTLCTTPDANIIRRWDLNSEQSRGDIAVIRRPSQRRSCWYGRAGSDFKSHNFRSFLPHPRATRYTRIVATIVDTLLRRNIQPKMSWPTSPHMY